MRLNPKLQNGAYVFVEFPHDDDAPNDAICIFREQESTTAIVPESVALARGWSYGFRAAWIILGAETSLDDLGITAAFSRVLSDNGISCNVFAPIRHDHIFVPYDMGALAVKLLEDLEL